MMFNPLEWFRANATDANREPMKKFASGLVAWLLAGVVVWSSQTTRLSLEKNLSSFAQLSWLGTLIGLILFWGGGILVLRPLCVRGYFQPWLARCVTVERFALAVAAGQTLAVMFTHWFYSHIETWMLAALFGVLVLGSAFGWKLPGSKRPQSDSKDHDK